MRKRNGKRGKEWVDVCMHACRYVGMYICICMYENVESFRGEERGASQ